MLSTCILKPLKTIAVPQYYYLREVCEPEIKVPHKERPGLYLNSGSLCCLLTKFFSAVVLQNPFLLPKLLVPDPIGTSLSHHRLPSLCAVWPCSPMQQDHLHCSQNLSPAIIQLSLQSSFGGEPHALLRCTFLRNAVLPSPSLLPLPKDEPPAGEGTTIHAHFTPILHNE